MPDKILPAFIDPTKTRSWTEGVATTGEISPQGTVTHTEHWRDRLDVVVRPSTVRMKQSTSQVIMPGSLTVIGEVEL